MGIMPKVEPDVLYNTSVVVFPSNSRPDMKHYTIWDTLTKRVVACSCEGYQAWGYCWHKDWVEEHWG